MSSGFNRLPTIIMDSDILGKTYILTKSEGFDQYMKELGVGLTLRKMGNTVVSQCSLHKRYDDFYTFCLECPYLKRLIWFKPNVPFKEVTFDNRVMQTVCKLNGNVFIQEQQGVGLKPTTIIREYRNKGNELITTLLVNNIKAVRYYEAVKPPCDEKKEKLNENKE